MRVGIDVSMIDSNKAGIGYYAYSMVKALSEIDSENEYFLFTYNKELLKDFKLNTNFNIIEVGGSGNLIWMLKSLPVIRKLHLDQFLSPSNLFWGCVLNNCTTVIHDIGQILHPEFFPKKGNIIYKAELKRLLARKGNVVVPTNAVKTEIVNNYSNLKSEITVIGEGLHDWVFNQYSTDQLENIKQKYNLPSKYLLSVGTLEPRKNLVNTILGFKEFLKHEPDYKLVIVGKKGWFFDKIFETVEENHLEEKVQFLGYVPDSDLAAIYDLSSIVISLSFYEGFGLPLIEANARGKFLLISDIDAYNELDVSAVRIKVDSTQEKIGDAMFGAVGREFENNQQFIDTYSWKRTALNLLSIWH